MKFYLILSILSFTYSCRTTAIALINPQKKESVLVEGQIKFVERARKKGVYILVDLKSKDLESIEFYIGNKDGNSLQGINAFYKTNPIKIDFDKEEKKAAYGILNQNWCLKCEDLHKELLGKYVFILDQNTKKIKASAKIQSN